MTAIVIEPLPSGKAEKMKQALERAKTEAVVSIGFFANLPAIFKEKHRLETGEKPSSTEGFKDARAVGEVQGLLGAAFDVADKILAARIEGNAGAERALQMEADVVRKNMAQSSQLPMLKEQMSDMFDVVLAVATADKPMTYRQAERHHASTPLPEEVGSGKPRLM